MDAPTRRMAEYAVGLRAEPPPPAAIRAVTRHLIDSIACALGALAAPPVGVARRIAATARSDFGASVIGSPARTTPEYAAFANTVMVRYLDYNDTGIGGHPSDMIPAVLGGVVGAGMILDLDLAAMANAISLAITPNIPMRVTRTGELSDWKGCATAHCALSAVLAARWPERGRIDRPEVLSGRVQRAGADRRDPCAAAVGGARRGCRPDHGRAALGGAGMRSVVARAIAPGGRAAQGPPVQSAQRRRAGSQVPAPERAGAGRGGHAPVAR